MAERLGGSARAAPPRASARRRSRSTPRLPHAARSFDPANGGFGGAPKFPPSRSCCSCSGTRARTGATMATWSTATLDAMARGGIYDQIGGGFARYASTRRWLVPHFEKMLYDNALLARGLPARLPGDRATRSSREVAARRSTTSWAG